MYFAKLRNNANNTQRSAIVLWGKFVAQPECREYAISQLCVRVEQRGLLTLGHLLVDELGEGGSHIMPVP